MLLRRSECGQTSTSVAGAATFAGSAIFVATARPSSLPATDAKNQHCDSPKHLFHQGTTADPTSSLCDRTRYQLREEVSGSHRGKRPRLCRDVGLDTALLQNTR